MASTVDIEVPTIMEHQLTGSYGAVLTTYRGHEYRVEFGKRYTRAFRDGVSCDPPSRVKIRAIDAYLNLLKPAFSKPNT